MSEQFDVLAKAFAESTRSNPIHVPWKRETLQYSAEDAIAFIKRGDDSAPSFSDAMFYEEQAKFSATRARLEEWVEDMSESGAFAELIDEAAADVNDSDDMDSIAFRISRPLIARYFDDVHFDENQFHKAVGDGILTYGAGLANIGASSLAREDVNTEHAEELLNRAQNRVKIEPERLAQLMNNTSGGTYSLWCTVSITQRALLDAFNGNKTITLASPTIYVGNIVEADCVKFQSSGALTLKFDELNPYFPAMNEYEANEVEQ